MIRRTLLIIFVLMFTLPGFAAITPQVDQRVEILSIVARLADYDEYNDELAKVYVERIHTHFDKFSGDSLIHYAVRIRRELGISFDAVMTMAVNLGQKKEIFSLQPNWRKDIDPRWTNEAATEFVRLLNRFYKTAHAGDFFSSQAAYYEKVRSTFGSVLSSFHQSWYFSYYGIQPKDEFIIVIGCGNGGSNYGPSVTRTNGSKKVYAIMGSWSFDKDGTPVFPQASYLPTLIHEFNHSFINPSIEPFSNNALLKQSMQTILDTMRTEMQAQAYTKWETVLVESLVRASVIRYMLSTGAEQPVIEKEFMEQLNRGFLWTRELVSLLGVYANERERYPTIESFYPAIIEFFSKTAANISLSKAEHEARVPRVVSIGPFENNAQDVDTTISQIMIRFNDSMAGTGYSFSLGELGKDADPVTGVIGYSDGNRTFSVNVALRAGKDYEMILTGRSFMNMEGYRLKRYIIHFRTKDAEPERKREIQ
jgi:hypothetical protein